MRRIHRLVIAAALALTGAATVHAQGTVLQPPARPARVARLVRASLAGIPLTDSERTALGAVRTHYMAQLRAIGEEAKPVMVRLRAARQARDTAAARAARAELRAERRKGAKTLRAALVDVRTALADEHRTRFDQNMLVIRAMLAPRPRVTGATRADR